MKTRKITLRVHAWYFEDNKDYSLIYIRIIKVLRRQLY